jgi:hypothetical protein
VNLRVTFKAKRDHVSLGIDTTILDPDNMMPRWILRNSFTDKAVFVTLQPMALRLNLIETIPPISRVRSAMFKNYAP